MSSVLAALPAIQGVVHGAAARAGSDGPQLLSSAKAVVLGLVEGVTEFLPISSTGHLLVTERLLDLPKSAALDSYTVIIQAGAILAVLLVSWPRVAAMLRGIAGRDAQGRRLLQALVVAFVPAAVIGKVLGDKVEEHLLRPWAVAVAWLVGGAVILLAGRFLFGGEHSTRRTSAGTLDTITLRQAAIIGAAQALALWPGTSRSLVTILAALAVGLSLKAAVEFSFLLGLATLGAATLYEVARHGDLVRTQIGVGPALIGIVCAAVSAAVAVKWMVGYLNRRDLAVFGYYRIGAALLTFALLASGAIASR